MLIGGFQKTSMIDYPEKIAAIVFTQGCNFRCPYCHNPELVTGIDKIADEQAVLDFLETRKGKLDGVVVTGGEPCLQKTLPDFLKKLKDKGFAVKLDTNGSKFEMLKDVIDQKLVDYVAMDIKAPLIKYELVAHTKELDINSICKSINLIMTSGVDYEFRTTLVHTFLRPNDFEQIGELVRGAKRYFLQRFVYTKVLLDLFKNAEPFYDEELEQSKAILRKYGVEHISIR